MRVHTRVHGDTVLDRIEREIAGEKAAALGRIGRRLQQISERLRVLWMARCAGHDGIDAEYMRLRREFFRYLWYWKVQREAMGFRTHPPPETWLFIPPCPEGSASLSGGHR